MWLNRYCIVLILTLFGVQIAKSQELVPAESFEQKIYFREAYRYVDYSYRNNRVALKNIISAIDSAQCNGTFISVDIQAWASPTGADKRNKLLAKNRSNELAKWISNNTNIPEEKIRKSSGGVGWNILRELVAASNAAYKDDVVDILDNTPTYVTDKNNNIVTGRRKKLMDHNYGRTWHDMKERFFPEIRCGLAVVINTKRPKPAIANKAEEIKAAEQRPTAAGLDKPDATNSTDTTDQAKSVATTAPDMPAHSVAPADKETPQKNDLRAKQPFFMAVRTNGLYDIMLVPNLGVEFYVGNGFTIGANWMYAWWDCNRKHKYWRVYGGDINIRKYFGRKAKEKPLQGHHLGIYVQAATYDFKLGSKGIMGGEPGGNIFDKANYGLGLEYGYSLPIAKSLNIDFTIGLGYFGGEYREYEQIDGHNVWQATKHRHFWGPTKAEISLVWLLGNKKGGKL